MARFTSTTQKYDENGVKIPKGRNCLRDYTKLNPELLIFDSKSEYETYTELKELEKAGEISELEIKKSFPLTQKRKWWNNVKKRWDIVRELTYITDFTFKRGGDLICLDCKGWRQKIDKKSGELKWSVYYDETYKIKKKLFLNMYPEYTFEEK